MSTETDEIMARSSFSTPAFAQLVRRLRYTNARYDQIAHQFRCRIRPTYHAKRRAYRAGLRVDIYKARTLSAAQISKDPFAILIKSGVSPSPEDSPFSASTTAGSETEDEEHDASQGDAYMRGLSLRNLPDVVEQKIRRRGGRKRVTLRLPPLKLSLDVNYGCGEPFEGPMPGAPRLLPRQLPEDESGVEEMTLGSALSDSVSSFMESSDALLTPSPYDDHGHSGLCITIPPRGVKRKLQDTEEDENTPPPFRQPKRVLMARWNESQRQ